MLIKNDIENNFDVKNNQNYNKVEIKDITIEIDDKCVCKHCGERNFHIHNRYTTLIKNGIKDGKIEYLRVHYCRFKCNNCNKCFIQNVDMRYKNTSITEFCKNQIIADFLNDRVMNKYAKKYDISNTLVKKIVCDFMKKQIEKNYEQLKNKITIISIDEKKIGKNTFYTIFRNYHTKTIIYITKGRDMETIKKFACFFGKNAENIQAVSIDKSISFISGIEKYLPNVKIVFDHFHVIANLTSKYMKKSVKNAINRKKGIIKHYMDNNKDIKKNEKNKDNSNNNTIEQIAENTKKIKDNQLKIKEYNKIIKFIRENEVLLYKNKFKLKDNEKQKLEILLNLDDELKEIYEIRSKITDLYRSNDYDYVKKEYTNLFEKLQYSKHKAVNSFCKNNIKYIEFLANHALYDISNAAMESLNRNIKMMYNRGRGYKDINFFCILITYFTGINKKVS